MRITMNRNDKETKLTSTHRIPQDLIIQLSKLFKIGRSDRADYVIDSSAVSKIHCQVYAVS